jgi:hypothetical protein
MTHVYKYQINKKTKNKKTKNMGVPSTQLRKHVNIFYTINTKDIQYK